MPQTRRDFVVQSLAAGAAIAALGATPAMARTARAPRKGLKILILGGTGFIGPAIVDAAKARGHSLTLFNRGKSEKRLGTTRDGVERLYGNRDPDLRSDDADAESPKGLSQIADAIKGGTTWDAVVDTSAFVPRIAAASADLLAPAAGQYVFISTISVYAGNADPRADESAPLGVMPNGDTTIEGITNDTYGPLKALCEQAVEKAFPGKATNIRPGFIVGPGDPSDRFTYWPVRTSQGGTMLAPGTPADPTQFVDVRDLADFVLTCIENKVTGAINVTGPQDGLPFGDLLNACKSASGANTTFEWVDAEFLMASQVAIGVEVPIWLPPAGETAGFHQRNVAKGVAAGLKFRPALDTCKAVLEWWPKEVERRTRVGAEMVAQLEKDGKPVPPQLRDPARIRTGLTPEREQALLKAWGERKK